MSPRLENEPPTGWDRLTQKQWSAIGLTAVASGWLVPGMIIYHNHQLERYGPEQNLLPFLLALSGFTIAIIAFVGSHYSNR